MTLLEINIETKIAVVSAIIALLSLMITYRISRTAKKSLKLAEKQYGDKLPDFETYFIQGFRFQVRNNNTMRILLLFQLTLKNKAELKNSLKAELEIEYLRNDDSFSKIMIDHNPSLESLIEKKNFSFFPDDIELDAKTTSTKWLIFEQPSYISKEHRIERYKMKFRDLHDNVKSSETVLIKEADE